MNYEKLMTWANTLVVACNTLDNIDVKGVQNMDKVMGIYQAFDQMSKQMVQEAQMIQENSKEEDEE